MGEEEGDLGSGASPAPASARLLASAIERERVGRWGLERDEEERRRSWAKVPAADTMDGSGGGEEGNGSGVDRVVFVLCGCGWVG